MCVFVVCMYTEWESLIKLTEKEDINFIIEDFNVKINKGGFQKLFGKFGLGERNQRSERLIEFFQEHDSVVINIWFDFHQRRLYTWTFPQYNSQWIARIQTDFVLVNHRYRNSVKNSKIYPSEDINSDHPGVASFEARFKTEE